MFCRFVLRVPQPSAPFFVLFHLGAFLVCFWRFLPHVGPFLVSGYWNGPRMGPKIHQPGKWLRMLLLDAAGCLVPCPVLYFLMVAAQRDGPLQGSSPVVLGKDRLAVTTRAPPVNCRGLGLPRSYAFARYLGGELQLVPIPGYGTNAYITLPRSSPCAYTSFSDPHKYA